MNLRLYLLLCCSLVVGQNNYEFGFGTCSDRCQDDYDVENPRNGSSAIEDLYKFPCSCSRSCSLFKDCCFDSEFKHEIWNVSRSYTMCLSLSTKGHFKAVGKCSSEWMHSDSFCRNNIGHLPPVTSLTTGITYSNLYCAECNEDGENLIRWNVNLRCCSEHDDLANETDRRIVYHKGNLWSKIPGYRKCQCSFELLNNDTNFLDNVQIRSCQRRLEISKCSSSWREDDVEQLCKSFLDPIYVGHKIYRNLHCAQCNFETLQFAKCMPNVVAHKLSQGADIAEIFEFCQSYRLQVCMYYLESLSKGRSYAFSSLVNINEKSCLPPPGRRCCEGERYDFRVKRCRKLSCS